MKDFSKINDRILYIIENQTSGNKRKFAERIGFAPQVVFNIVSGRKTKPSFDVLEAIITSFDDISSEWLLTGQGSILREDKQSAIITATPATGDEGIPLIPVKAMAGYANGDVQVLDYEITQRYHIPDFENKGVKFMANYPPFSIRKESIRKVAIVVGVIRLE